MIAILSFTGLFAVLLHSVWEYGIKPNQDKPQKGHYNVAYIMLLCAIAFIIRCLLAAKYMGHKTDIQCFMGWSNMVFKDGLSNFYASESFTDYPPGYMYVLYIIGAIQNTLNLSDGLYWLLIKLPAIICDVLTGIFIYKIASKKFNDAVSAIISGVYLFNPAVVLNSSLWGQVDSIYTLFVILMVYLLTNKQLIKAYFTFALCIFIKPQAFIFTPLIIYAIIDNVFLPKFDKDKFFKNLSGGLLAIAMIFVLALPFGIGHVFEQYKTTLASYPYLTVNAFNIWGALGQNWEKLTPFTSALGYIILVLIVIYTTVIFFKSDRKNGSVYYFAAAFLSLATYMLSTKMHDRYAFSAMAFLLIAFIINTNSKHFIMYSGVTLLQLFNTAWVLFIYEQDINKFFKSPVIIAASVVNIILFAFIIFISVSFYINNKQDVKVSEKKEKITVAKETEPTAFSFMKTKTFERLNKKDYIAIGVLMLVYSCIALYNLGDTVAPQTFSEIGSLDGVTIDLGEEYKVKELKLYLGAYQLNEKDRPLNISYLNSSKAQTNYETVSSGSVFCWSTINADTNARYIHLSTTAKNLNIMELGVYDENSELIKIKNYNDQKIMSMFDEQELIPDRKTYLNGTYFDEIYHARTAYEFVNHLDVYEWTHPPLGKVFISLGIRLFGMTPFGWRIIGTLFGILMIPVIYVFARRLLKKQWLATVTAILLTFDFMHFTQTRIATIDVYVTFFIMIMYYFMYRYCQMSFNDTALKKTLIPLSLSGIFMGFAIASKWTGIYAGCGLAIIFFSSLYGRYKEYLYALKSPADTTDGISHQKVISDFKGNVIKTILCCVVFFVIVPLAIYGLSYIPYLKAPSAQGIKTIIDNQNSMWTYHSKTVVNSTHPYSSHWYEWLFMKRPIWYYSGTISDTVKEGISAFGNPLVWWLGVPAFLYTLYLAITRKSKSAAFLAVAYLAGLLPWVPVARTTYIYHYFPCVPFLVLMLGYTMKTIYNDTPDKPFKMYSQSGKAILGISDRKKLVIALCFVYAALVIGMFIMFYPVLSGAPCSVWFAQTFLKWFNSWVLL